MVICSGCLGKLTRFCNEEDRLKPPTPMPLPAPDDREGIGIRRETVSDWVRVGEGTWGVVYKAEWHGPVAVKKLKCAKNPSDKQVYSLNFDIFIFIYDQPLAYSLMNFR